MNHREGPLSTFLQSNQNNIPPAFLAHNILDSQEKPGELHYQFSDLEDSYDSSHHVPKTQSPAGIILSQSSKPSNSLQTNKTPAKNGVASNSIKLQQRNSDHAPSSQSKQKANYPEIEIRSPSSGASWDKAKEKMLQAQLEVSQSKLVGLSKRIDACLAISKTEYSNSKVFQPSETSASRTSRTSLNDPQEGKTMLETLQVPKGDNTNRRETPEEGNGIYNIDKRTGGSKKNIDAEKGGNPHFLSTDFQKQFETVSSMIIETINDQPKESHSTPSPLPSTIREETHNNTKTNSSSKATYNSSSTSHKLQAPGHGPQFSFSSKANGKGALESPAKKEVLHFSNQRLSNIGTRISPRGTANSSTGPSTGPKSSQKKKVPQNTHYNFEEQKDIYELELDQSEFSQSPIPQKLEAKAELSQKTSPVKNGSNNVKNNSITMKNNNNHLKNNSINNKNSKPVTKEKKQLLVKPPQHNLETESDRLEISQALSPVLNGKSSSRVQTPGYQFDAQNLSLTDPRETSYDSALLGRESNGRRQERKSLNSRNTATAYRSTDKDEMRASHSRSQALSQGRQERSFYDDELESSFVKAYTTRKNKIVNDMETFEERVSSDIYFRRRFKNELQQFLDQYQPKLNEEDAEVLYDRLVMDGKQRQVRAQKRELSKIHTEKLSHKSYSSIPEDQVNQTFDRLVADARKRVLIQEEKEKFKILKSERELEDYERESNSKKMKKEDEEQLVYKMMQDANRRRIHFEKMQRAKVEAELREAKEMMSQKFVNKNNRAKSKVKQYIENQVPLRVQTQQEQEPMSTRAHSRPKSSKLIKAKDIQYDFDDKSKQDSDEEGPVSPISGTGSSGSKFASVRSRYLNSANRIQTEGGSPKRSRKDGSPKNSKLSSLEYLKNLRKDIDKYRSNIEENIQTIQGIENGPLSESQHEPAKAKKFLISNMSSPRAETTVSTPYKSAVSSKYKNVESKVAKHIEGGFLSQSDSGFGGARQSLKNGQGNKGPVQTKIGGVPKLNKSNKNGKLGNASERDPNMSEMKTVTSPDEKEKRMKIQAKFMSAQNAINFVEKLINDFKTDGKY